jgi:hypothetical protein
MVASGSGWVIGWMGGRQDWADHSTISRSSVKAWKAGVRDVGDCIVHSPQRGDGEGRGGSMRSTVSFSGALGLAVMEWAVVSGKWGTGRDRRTGSIFVQRLLAGGAI